MENEEAMNSKYPRKLNFNAPLLSIRRTGGYTDEEQSCTNSRGMLANASDDRIPFSWEQAPGKPKDLDRAEKVQEFDSLKLKLAESRGSESPNFIIRRFLPDATALAASSALAFSKSFNKRPSRQCNCPEACELHPVIGQSYDSPKGCGLEILFPWRMKHKICGVKSPIRQDSLKVQPQCREKPKKHSSSSSKPLPM
ncbi:hypothetical protein CFP56_043899 [Quercus suber]|uniref:Uncharacterized protein n=1 Tax=Quercus suber TaxID=58331 RepID=A0AAW0IQR2_QUESU